MEAEKPRPNLAWIHNTRFSNRVIYEPNQRSLHDVLCSAFCRRLCATTWLQNLTRQPRKQFGSNFGGRGLEKWRMKDVSTENSYSPRARPFFLRCLVCTEAAAARTHCLIAAAEAIADSASKRTPPPPRQEREPIFQVSNGTKSGTRSRNDVVKFRNARDDPWEEVDARRRILSYLCPVEMGTVHHVYGRRRRPRHYMKMLSNSDDRATFYSSRQSFLADVLLSGARRDPSPQNPDQSF